MTGAIGRCNAVVPNLPHATDHDRTLRVEELFERHYDALCDLAFLILGDRHLGEEIVMDALVKIFSGWGRIRDVDRADVYLKRTVVNLCRSRIRRKVIERRVNEIAHGRAEDVSHPWDPAVGESARNVWTAVRSLPVRQRACIVLRYAEDLSDEQIGRILDCSPSTVRSQLARARSKLTALLEAER